MDLEIPRFLRRDLWTPEQVKANDLGWKARLARRFEVEDKAKAIEAERRKRATLENKIAAMRRRRIEPGSFQERILASLERQLRALEAGVPCKPRQRRCKLRS